MKFYAIGKYGRYAGKNESTNCFLIKTDNGKNIVIDLGSGSISKLQNYIDLSAIDILIVTHLHFDHMCDLGTLGYAMQYLKLPRLKVYMPKSPEGVANILNMPQFDIEYIDKNTRFCVDNVNFSFMFSPHPVECYSVIIKNDGKKLVYTSDCADSEQIKNNCAEADVVIANTCILDKDYKQTAPHCSVKTFAENVPNECKLYLAHLTAGDENLILAEAKKYHINAEIVCNFEF